MFSAIVHGNLDIIIWLYDNNLVDIYLREEFAFLATFHYHSHILKWLFKKKIINDPSISRNIFLYALQINASKIYKWHICSGLLENVLKDKIDVDRLILSILATKNIYIIKYILRNVIDFFIKNDNNYISYIFENIFMVVGDKNGYGYDIQQVNINDLRIVQYILNKYI